jgi:hypothetical protein
MVGWLRSAANPQRRQATLSVAQPGSVNLRPESELWVRGMRRRRSTTSDQLRGIWLQLRLSRCGTTTD